MPKFVNSGDSLEGKRILAHGRKIVSGGLPTRHKVTKKIRFPIDIKLGGGARIDKPYDPPPDKPNGPPVAVFSPHSHLQLNDELIGNMLEGASEKHFRPDDCHVGGSRSGTHPGQSWTMEGDCFIRIVTNWLKQLGPIQATKTAPLLKTPGPKPTRRLA